MAKGKTPPSKEPHKGAPEGNQFWKLRSKHGRDKLFSTPELLWEAASEYFEHTDKRKWIKTEFKGKDATECHVPIETPYTLSGLCLYLECSRNWWNEFRKANHKDFLGVLARIEEIMYTQKFEGAAVGTFNHSIISHDLGLVNKQAIDITTQGDKIETIDYSKLSLEVRKAILAAVNKPEKK